MQRHLFAISCSKMREAGTFGFYSQAIQRLSRHAQRTPGKPGSLGDCCNGEKPCKNPRSNEPETHHHSRQRRVSHVSVRRGDRSHRLAGSLTRGLQRTFARGKQNNVRTRLLTGSKQEMDSRKLLVPSETIPGFPSEAVVVLAYLARQEHWTEVKWPRGWFRGWGRHAHRHGGALRSRFRQTGSTRRFTRYGCHQSVLWGRVRIQNSGRGQGSRPGNPQSLVARASSSDVGDSVRTRNRKGDPGDRISSARQERPATPLCQRATDGEVTRPTTQRKRQKHGPPIERRPFWRVRAGAARR